MKKPLPTFQDLIFDKLSNTLAKDYFFHLVDKEIARNSRITTVSSLLLFEFELENRTSAELLKEVLIKKIATVLNKQIRKSDEISYLGNYEFALLLPETDMDGALVLAKRIEMAILEAEFELDDGELLEFSAHYGISLIAPKYKQDREIQASELYIEADKHKFFAKYLNSSQEELSHSLILH
ncbi:MAG: diguanylate cyclase [Alphaproteobacteria bacterium]|jgi:diguanylate cyclase (GGDEF)-like protein